MTARGPFQAVLFDLDGTLLHTSPDLAAAANAALAESNLPAVDAAVIEGFVGKGGEVLIERCLMHLGAAGEERKARVLGAFERLYEAMNGAHSVLYPGVIEGLEAMRALGLQLGVCTNKRSQFTHSLLERSGLASRFGIVVCGDTTANRKPHPDMLVWAAARLGLDPSEILMIGDSGNDVAAARAAGCDVWLVPYGYREGAALRDLGGDGIVSTLDEAARLLAAGRRPEQTT